MAPPSIGFLFLGGAHQILHLAPVALELELSGAGTVRLLAAGEAERSALIGLWSELGLAEPDVELLPVPAWAKVLARAKPGWSAAKLPTILAARDLLSSFDAVVAAERTCTILKYLPGRKPYMIHIPHGAGDRAKGFERRIGLFDHVIVAGQKDCERLVTQGVCEARNVSVSGYVKLAAVNRLRARAPLPRVFENDRPTVLYNPHFAPELSSWPKFADALISSFVDQQEFNLIIAPHVRMFGNAPADVRRAVEARAVPDRVHVDLGSSRSNDMTYTLAADVYVGDVSSQVYEFLQEPKPCVFLNPGIDGWQSDPSYNFWRLGEVVDDPTEILAAVRRAPGLHTSYAAAQVRARDLALGPIEPSPIVTAAGVIANLAESVRAAA